MRWNPAKMDSAEKYDGDYDVDLAALQDRLERVQAAHITHSQRSIIVFEGWDAAGKGGIISRLSAPLDPRFFQVWPISAPTPEEKAHHFLWRFWKRLPALRAIAIFDRSYYGRVLVERVEGFATKDQWQLAYDEINSFEAQIIRDGAHIVKLFIHVAQEEQDRRFADRLSDPWKRWKTGVEDYRNRSKRDQYIKAMQAMFAKTHTDIAPWKIINGNNKKAARIAALTYIVETLEQCVPMVPPKADPMVLQFAKEAFGYEPKS